VTARRLLAALLVLASPPALAEPCAERDPLAAWLRLDHGMKLVGWGISREGNMLEFFHDGAAHFAVIQTTPHRCATILAMTERPHARLEPEAPRNHAVPPARRLSEGEEG
jgi:hypothetical protein